MSFNDFIHKYKSKKQAISKVKIYQIFSSLSLNDVWIYKTVGQFLGDAGIVILHPFKGSHWVAYINENFFESYGCAPPQKLFRFIKKRTGH